MPNAIRYAILDHAGDDANLWELPWSLSDHVGGGTVEIHPPRTVDEVRPHLIDLVREGHVELYRMNDPRGPKLSLDEALAVVADDTNWYPPTETAYCVITTDSGDREYEIERQTHEQGR